MTLLDLLQYQEKAIAASISIEVRHPAFYHCASLRLTPDQYLHHADFCRAVKLRDNHASCSANKRRSLEVARHGRSFSGCCPHGVWEYARPVLYRGELVAVLYYGNLRPEWKADEEHRNPLRSRPDVPEERRKTIRAAAAFVAEFLKIELDLFSTPGGANAKQRPESYYLENCRNFINCHYLENIALSDLAELLKVNPNYLGTLIRQQTGSSFRTLLARRRIEESKFYLKFHKDLSITKVARLCGFTDSNYFSCVFRKLCGHTPLTYKKEEKPDETPARPGTAGTPSAGFRRRNSGVDSAAVPHSGNVMR